MIRLTVAILFPLSLALMVSSYAPVPLADSTRFALRIAGFVALIAGAAGREIVAVLERNRARRITADSMGAFRLACVTARARATR